MTDEKYALFNNLTIRPRDADTYKIIDDYIYKDITVPAGYHTDGASVPRIFWIFWPPNRSAYLPAVIIHDYLCDLEEYEKADRYFKEIMEILEVNPITIFSFHKFVITYHWIRYDILKIK